MLREHELIVLQNSHYLGICRPCYEPEVSTMSAVVLSSKSTFFSLSAVSMPSPKHTTRAAAGTTTRDNSPAHSSHMLTQQLRTSDSKGSFTQSLTGFVLARHKQSGAVCLRQSTLLDLAFLLVFGFSDLLDGNCSHIPCNDLNQTVWNGPRALDILLGQRVS